MATINVSQLVNRMRLGGSDKVALTTLLTGLVNDIETLRANQRACTTKLDSDAGVTDVNYTTLTSTASGGLSVGR